MIRLVLALLMMLAGPALAVNPEEMLEDPALEARAQEIDKEIRCPLCQGEPIAESRAPISSELRLLVRERLLAGDTDAEVVDYIAARFGEAVRLSPKAEGAGLVLWLAAPVLLILGGFLVWGLFRKSGAEGDPQALSTEEQARLDALLKDPPTKV